MKELGGLQKQETALQDQLENIASDVESFTTFLNKGLYPKSKLNAVKREQSRLEGQLGAMQGDLARNEKVVEETRLQIRQAQQNTSTRRRRSCSTCARASPRPTSGSPSPRTS